MNTDKEMLERVGAVSAAIGELCGDFRKQENYPSPFLMSCLYKAEIFVDAAYEHLDNEIKGGNNETALR